MMAIPWKNSALAWLAAIGFLGMPNPAVAHPHVWASVREIISIQDGYLVGIRMEWKLDPMYSSSAIRGLDQNNDGKFDRAELAGIAKTSIEGLDEFDYFTHVSVARVLPISLARPTDYWFDFDGNCLTLHLYLPLHQAIPATSPHLRIKVEDSSNFIEFHLAETNPIKFDAAEPCGCKARIGGEPQENRGPDSVAAQSPRAADSVAEEIEVVCP